GAAEGTRAGQAERVARRREHQAQSRNAVRPQPAQRALQRHDEAHLVDGLDVDAVPLERALGRLRADGVPRLRLVLPAPGDPLGLPGPGPFSSAALDAGEGVLAVREDGTGTGLVPAVTAHGSALDGTVTTVRWTAYRLAAVPPWSGPFLADADADLRRGVVQVAAALRDLDVARWRPELADALRDLRAAGRAGLADADLPPGYPDRARDVLVRSRQLAGVLELAGADSGGAVDSREAAAREAQLRELAGLVRRAQVAAWNSCADLLQAGSR
ncbi:MAG TPA: hypothetical protein VNU26_00145, partial [Mycobacteriales bacterium]|nr:hypothetical protein [Mycobacteriales bacterium]